LRGNKAFDINPLTGTLNLQSNGPLYSNTVIDRLAIVGWAVTFGTAAATPKSLFSVQNVTAHPSTASLPISYNSMWHYNYLCPSKC